MKKEVINKNRFNNRLLYTFILLGLIFLLSAGIYAVDTSTAWHSASQIDFTGVDISPNKVTTSNLCISVDCRTSWPTFSIPSDLTLTKLTTTNLCLSGDCRTSWPSSSSTSSGGPCPDGFTTTYNYINNGEDTMSGFTPQEVTIDTCGTPTTTAVTDASIYCSVNEKKTCIDIDTRIAADTYGSAILVRATSCSPAEVDTCDGKIEMLKYYTCGTNEVKDCDDFYLNSVGYCMKKTVNCRNNAQTVTCKQYINGFSCLSD